MSASGLTDKQPVGSSEAAQPLARPGIASLVSKSDAVLLLVLIVLAVAGPMLGGFYLYVFTLAGIYAIVTIGNNLLLSHGGLLSLGQGGLVAISCYACAYSANAGLPFIATLIVGTAVAAVAGFIVGLPALRLSGHYLALVTLAFAIAVGEVIVVLDTYTGGTSGIGVTQNVLSPMANFYAILATIAIASVLQSRTLASRFGIALRLVRDSERAAASCGIKIARYKLTAFVYSGILAGLSGAFFVSATGYVAPMMFDLWLSIYLLVAVVLGGMRSPAGAVFGAALVAIVQQIGAAYQGLSSIIFGAALLLVLYATRSNFFISLAGRFRNRTVGQ